MVLIILGGLGVIGGVSVLFMVLIILGGLGVVGVVLAAVYLYMLKKRTAPPVSPEAGEARQEDRRRQTYDTDTPQG